MDIDNVTANAPPDCSAASADKDTLWPPNHKFHDISVVGVTDPEGDAFTINITAVAQDEWTNGDDDGNVWPGRDRSRHRHGQCRSRTRGWSRRI